MSTLLPFIISRPAGRLAGRARGNKRTVKPDPFRLYFRKSVGTYGTTGCTNARSEGLRIHRRVAHWLARLTDVRAYSCKVRLQQRVSVPQRLCGWACSEHALDDQGTSKSNEVANHSCLTRQTNDATGSGSRKQPSTIKTTSMQSIKDQSYFDCTMFMSVASTDVTEDPCAIGKALKTLE